MVQHQPPDVDAFFKEQDERMNASESDWEEYEERVYQDRKRKREQRKQAKQNALEGKSAITSGDVIENEAPRSAKKQKLSQADDPTKLPPSVQHVPSPSHLLLEDADVSPQKKEVSVVSSHRQSTRISQVKVRKRHTEPPTSDITSPITSPVNKEASTSTLPQTSKDSETSVNPSKSKATRSLSEIATKNGAAKPEGTKKRVATRSASTVKSASTLKREAEKLKKAQQDTEALMTPLEYAAILHQKWQARVLSTPPEKLFLNDCAIFMVFEEKNKSTKDTRIKLDIIARHGGQVATKYDAGIVTHIIPGGSSISQKKVLQALDLKSLSEIPPEIHTVKWDWIVSGLTNGKADSEIMHELYKERLVNRLTRRSSTSDVKGKGKGKEQTSNHPYTNEHSVIEDFSAYDSANEDDGKEPFVLPQKSATANRKDSTPNSGAPQQDEDPLLPFYAKAREDAQTRASDDEPIIPLLPAQESPKASKLKGFQCDKKLTQAQENSPNRDIIEKLAELREMHRDMGADGDRWRVLGYQKAIGSLKAHPTRIKSREEALKLNGISDKTADKIMEIVRTGELQRIKYTKTHDLAAIRAFSGIYGVGTNIARKWFNQGVKSLDDLKKAVHDETLKLTKVQEIGLKYYDDINDRMPRSEAEEIFLKIKPLALSLDPKLSLDIMGSFRRGKTTCGDIDILLTRSTDDGKTHAGILLPLCNLLGKHGILTEDLAVPEDWHGLEATYRGLCRRDESSRRRRIDILCIPYESRGAARIYYTGDDIFNRSIRLKANKMGMSLNQRGLYQEVIRDPHDRTKKLSRGSLLCSDSERKIFEILGVPWQEPHERVRG